MSVEYRAVRLDEREACLHLWTTAFPHTGADYFRRYFEGDVEWLPYYTQVGLVDGQIVSAVQIVKRTVACGDFRLTMGGIANVATLPDFRGQHHNTECLKRAIAVMEADAFDFALLFTGIQDYYARHGFVTLPGLHYTGHLPAQEEEPSESGQAEFSVRPALPDDLPAIFALYDRYNARRPIAVQRYPAYWRDWIGIAETAIPDGLRVAVDAAGTVYGYALSRIQSGDDRRVGVIQEMALAAGASDPRIRIAAALLRDMGERVTNAGERWLRLEAAPDPDALAALASLTHSPHTHPVRSGMARILHRTHLLDNFTLELNERWQQAGRPPGTLTFATPYGPLALQPDGAFLRVAEVNGEDDAAETGLLGQDVLLALLFGLIEPEAATPDITLHPLLQALFPPQAAVYYPTDGF